MHIYYFIGLNNQKFQISKLLVHFNLFPGHRQHFFLKFVLEHVNLYEEY